MVKSAARALDYSEVLSEDGRRLATAEPLGISVARVKGGSVDLASDRFQRGESAE